MNDDEIKVEVDPLISSFPGFASALDALEKLLALFDNVDAR